MSSTKFDEKQVREDNRRMAATISTLRQHERQLTTTNKMQRTDIESLKKRLEQLGAENNDLLEKLAEMKRDKAQSKRQFDEQMKEAAEKLRQLKESCDPELNNEQLQMTRQQLEEAHRNTDRLKQELDAEKRRYSELERVNAELQSRLEGAELQKTQSLPANKSDKYSVLHVQNIQWKQQLESQIRDLTKELSDARQRLTDQANTSNKVRQKMKRLVRDKAELEEKNHELSSALDNLKRNNDVWEQEKELLYEQLNKRKLELEACNIAQEEQKKQLQSVDNKKQELEQMIEQIKAEQSGSKRIEKMLRDDLEKIRQTENDRAVKEVELKRQLAKSQEDYNTLSRKMQSDIDGLKDKSNGISQEVDKLRKMNLHLSNNESQLKAELEEAKKKAESTQRKLQQEIDTLRIDLRVYEETHTELNKERDEMLEKWVPKEHLENVKTELKELTGVTQEAERRIEKLKDKQEALQRTNQERENELNQEIEKVRSELKTKEEQLEKAAGQSRELEKKNEKLKQSYEEKQKLSRKEQEKLEQTIKEQHNAFQEKIHAKEAQHMTDKEHMLKAYNEKEKELKNKMKIKEVEIRAEIDRLKSKCEHLERTHEETLREKDEDAKRQIKKLKVEIKERNKQLEDAIEQNKELHKVIDDQVCLMNELKTLRSANDELKEKTGKLERALLRLRLENDELREYKDCSVKNEYVKELNERTTLQVEMLRHALEDRSKTSPRRSLLPTNGVVQSSGVHVDDHSRMLGELAQLLKTSVEDGKRQVGDSTTLVKELEAERNKVRAGSERIAQLERWLDTIFSDQQLGIGTSAVYAGTVSLPPVGGTSNIPTVGKTTRATNKPSDRSPNKEKPTQISTSKRQ